MGQVHSVLLLTAKRHTGSSPQLRHPALRLSKNTLKEVLGWRRGDALKMVTDSLMSVAGKALWRGAWASCFRDKQESVGRGLKEGRSRPRRCGSKGTEELGDGQLVTVAERLDGGGGWILNRRAPFL